jgi:hypothetical protein
MVHLPIDLPHDRLRTSRGSMRSLGPRSPENMSSDPPSSSNVVTYGSIGLLCAELKVSVLIGERS